jgi:DNA replication protein DnaC
MTSAKHDKLKQDLDELKLSYITENYREILDDAARKNTSTLDVLIQLIGGQVAARRDRALERRVRDAHLPKPKTLAEYDFTFPKKIAKQKLLRLFDCQFVDTYGCAVLIGSTGLGKPRPPQYTSSYRGVRG